MHRDGMRNASRGKKIFITMEKKRPREAEKRAFKSRKTMSCGAENYGLVFFNVTFSIYFSCMFYGIPFFFYTFAAKILTINF